MSRGTKLSTTAFRLALGVAAGWALLALCLFALVLALFLLSPTDHLPIDPLQYVFIAAFGMIPGGPLWLLLHWLRPRLVTVAIAFGVHYAIGLVVFAGVWIGREKSVGVAVSVGEIVLGFAAITLAIGLIAALTSAVMWRIIYGRAAARNGSAG